MMLRVAFHTLGCRLNQAETALAADDLSRHGFACVPWGQDAEVLVINSCAVTGVASQKTRQAVRAARRRHPAAFLVLMGCDALVDREAWGEEGPDLVVPHPVPGPLSSLLPKELVHVRRSCILEAGPAEEDFQIEGAARFEERTRANLKIQDGCNFFCTYCVVPYSRGPARSRALPDVLREARELVAAGYRELVLCGVNVTTYESQGADMADLIAELLKMEGDFRIRIGSAEPSPVIRKVVALMEREPRLCRFLHLPLQHGDEGVLERMGRAYTAAEYRDMAFDAARRIPGLCLGADVIAGFPGEDEAAFDVCRFFVECLPFGLLHVFPYSRRPGTEAAAYREQVSGEVAARRAEELGRIAAGKAEAFARSQVGQALEVLFEEGDASGGWSDNYLHVTLEQGSAQRNTIRSVRITRATGGRELLGVLAGE